MEVYDRRTVYAPEWMKTFVCLAGDCPDTCCRDWNIEINSEEAERFRRLDDPELQAVMDRLLHSMRFRRPGSRQTEIRHRLQLLDQPDERCPFLNERAECRLQKKYGAYFLCDTCYFFPRSFRQIDEKTYLSACLFCRECARLALLHREPTRFAYFETEIDPEAEWLETELIPDPGARELLRRYDEITQNLCSVLQDRRHPFKERMEHALAFLKDEEARYTPAEGSAAETRASAGSSAEIPSGELMRLFADAFDPINTGLEKPAQSAASFLRGFAAGSRSFSDLLAESYEQGRGICGPFFRSCPHLEENFMVHCVFSDSFRQFYRYQNETLTAAGILRHEAALLTAWYWFFRVQMSRAALAHGEMTEEIFLQAVSDADRTYWHYPDWFARCAGRMIRPEPYDLANIIRSL